ncbi:MAG TPA: glycosyltransferase family 2 protein [Planctomycetota bacterium]|nr:glycosyltransferase family 2 protein [Planctomycetota bacterium]
MKVAAIVLNWNGGDDTLRCLASLRASRSPIDVVVVDNASTDGSVDRIADAFPEAWILLQAKNKGFCGGVNAGVRYAAEKRGAEAVFLLNNDAWVDPGFLAPLVAELERDPRVGAVGSKVLFADDPDRIWSLGGRLGFTPNVTALVGHGALDRGGPTEPLDAAFVPGCALLARTSLFLEMGGLDADYFAYMEDVDFSLRLRAAGWKLRIVPASRVLHRPSSSTGGGYSRGRKYAMGLNSVRLLRRHGSLATWSALLVFDVAGLPIAWAREALRRGGDPGAVVAKARGMRDGWRGERVTAEAFERFRARPAGAA